MVGWEVSVSQNSDLRNLPKRYIPKEVEAKWQSYWLKPEIYEIAYEFVKDDFERPMFILDTPPPFTSGELHVGHAYWNIINDTIARYKRMRGFNVLLPQGWDCQGLPTELKVQNIWKIPKTDRGFFRKKCIEWTQKMIASMKETMIKMGYRPDWERFEYRTIDASYQRSVQQTLLRLYEKELIYRSVFPVHWCPHCETALAQAELGYIDEMGWLFYVKFLLGDKFLEVATTRPELLSACQALVVHPEDERYIQLVGKMVRVPLLNRDVPILANAAVDMEFGTGVVMICTFGDEQDIRWQQKYELPVSKVLDEQGRLVNSGKYNGLKIVEARTAMVTDLTAAGLLSKKERVAHRVLCHTERSDCLTPVEFLVKTQFFIKVKPFKKDVIKACKGMQWIPRHMLQRLLDWVRSIEWDWVISRQRVYGTPLPFWYCDVCNEIIPALEQQLPIIPETARPPAEKCPKCSSTEVKPTMDVCDCWVDSSITPLIISGHFDDEKKFEQYYPTSVRQQGHDIIRTWLFYTTLRCLQLTGTAPFREVLVNGHVLGPDGHKMSKSKGNVISPEDRLEEFGADSLRQALLSLTMGSDFPFRWETVKYSKGFLQKYWSASRFAYQFIKDYQPSDEGVKHLRVLDRWIIAKLADTINRVTETLEAYEFHLALDAIQNFLWHDFCDQYIEAVKYRLYDSSNEESRGAVRHTIYTVLWNSNLILSPICPHITEELYHMLFTDLLGTVHAERWPSIEKIRVDKRAKDTGDSVIEVIGNIRNEKAKRGIPLNSTIEKATIAMPRHKIEAIRESEEDIKGVLHIKEVEFRTDNELAITLTEE